LSGAEPNKMREKNPRWESELWTYLSRGDGIHCPIYQSCQTRREDVVCFSEQIDYGETVNEFVDSDESDFAYPADVRFKSPNCPLSGRVFKLIRKLAKKCQMEAGLDCLPVPNNLITRAYDNLPIEVRKVSVRSYHGAVWRLNDCWLIQLNNNDTPARQRFTLYHEIFHILAHCKATPVFKKVSCGSKGSFNELLADHFALTMLIPERWVKEKWTEVKDVNQMAAIFDAPKSLMWFVLHHLHLIP
jgi:hypothetical protein